MEVAEEIQFFLISPLQPVFFVIILKKGRRMKGEGERARYVFSYNSYVFVKMLHIFWGKKEKLSFFKKGNE